MCMELIHVVDVEKSKRVAIYKEWSGESWVYAVRTEALFRWFWPLPFGWVTSGWGNGEIFIAVQKHYIRDTAIERAEEVARNYKEA